MSNFKPRPESLQWPSILLLLVSLLSPHFVVAQSADASGTSLATEQPSAVDVESRQATLPEDQPVALSVEALKKKVIELNRDLFILEEDLLFPANTQFTVFLSMDTGRFLQLDSVKLKVNDETVAAHLYTGRQLKALQNGGMQRLYMGNLKTGEHEVSVFVQGTGPDRRDYKKAATLLIEKGTDLKALEVRISDRSSDYQPEVSISEWEQL